MANQNNDIAKHKQPEKKLKIEKESAEQYLDIAGVIIVALNNKGETTLLNKKGYEVLQYEEGELLGKNWFETCIPDRIREEVFGVFKRLMRGELDPIEFFENPVLTKNGEERLISWYNSSLYDDEGNIIGILSSGEDVTERKRAEDVLRESEEHFRSVVETAYDAIITINGSGDVVFWNRGAEIIFGYSSDEINRKPITVIMPERFHEAHKKGLNRLVSTGNATLIGKTVEMSGLRKDGSEFPIELTLATWNTEEGFFFTSIIRDITDRKQAEKEIKKSKQVLEDITQGIKEHILLLSKDLKILWANKAVLELYGYKLEDLIGKYCYEVTHHRKRTCEPPLDPCPIYNTQQTDPSQPLIHTHFDQKGNKIFAEVIAYPLKDEKGEIVQFVHISRDVTKRKLMEDSLKVSEEKYRSLFEESRDAIYIVTREGKFVDINDSMLKIVGYSREEMLELNAQELYVHPADRSAFQQEIEKKGSAIDFKVKFHKKDRTEIDCLLTSTKWGGDEKDYLGYQGILRDVTEQKLLEDSLRERTHDLSERVKELNCLYGISKLVETPGIVLEEILQEIVELIPPGWQHPEITCARIIINDQEFRTENFRDTIWKQTSDIIMDSDRIGTVEVYYLEEKPEIDEVPFLKEERHLIDAIAERLGETIQRKRAEEALKNSEERLKEGQKVANYGNWDWNIETNELFWSDQIYMIFGLQPQKIRATYETFLMSVHPDDREFVKKSVNDALSKKKPYAIDHRVVLPDGSVRVVQEKAKVFYDKSGEPNRMLGTVQDITERKKMEEKIKEYTENLEKMVEERTMDLKDSEKKFRQLADQSPNMIFINKKGKVLYVNKRCEELMGYTKEEFYSPDFNFLSLMTPDSIEIVNSSFDKHMTGEEVESYEYTLVTKDGKRIEAIMSSRLIDYEGETAILGIVTDITERKRFEETIHESETRYRGLYESSMDGIVSADMEGKFIDCNQAFADMLGYTKEELYNLSYPEVSPSKWHELNYRIITEQVIPRGFSDEVEMEGIKKNGEIFPISLRLWLTKDKEGRPTGMWGIIRDITKRKRAEEALLESEERYRSLFESSIDGIGYVDMEGKFIRFNQAYEDMLGYTKEELNNLTIWDMTQHKWHNLTQKIHEEQVIPRGYSDEYEKEYVRKDGTVFPIAIRTWLIKDKEGKPAGLWAIVRDISERKKLDKMKAEFIDLTAHELRTPLGALKAHVELLKIKSDQGYWTLPKEVHNKIDIITRNAKRLTILINNLVDYTRIEAGSLKLKLRLASIEEVTSKVIKEALPLAQKHKHALTFNVPNPLPLIHMDEDIVGSILNNVISNAIKYTPEGGAIDVMILEEEDNLHITVKDTGIGIAEEDLEKIFRPFYVVDLSQSVLFQSKSEFERLGMGLAVAKEYINMLGGKIWAESPVGEGSIFHILFPKK